MQFIYKIVALLTLAAGLTASATAAVIPGSAYGVYFAGSLSQNDFFATPSFDGNPEQGTRGDQLITIDEVETALLGGSSLIDVMISGDSDLFPIDGETGFFGVGVVKPFEFANAVTLDDARLILRNLAGDLIFSSDNLAGLVSQNAPWDGSFLAIDMSIGVDTIGAMNVSNIEFLFSVSPYATESPVPEPGSLALLGFAVLALAVTRMRRRHK